MLGPGPCPRAFCPWPREGLSLASRGSVFGRAVLGLGFFCVLGFGLNSTSAYQGQNGGQVDRVPATETKDSDSIPGLVKPETIKIGIHIFLAR